MYTLYLDGSGTHGNSPVFILAGIAIHEQDAYYLQQRLTSRLGERLPSGADPRNYEIHATELKSPRKPTSEWWGVPVSKRFEILRASYRALRSYNCVDAAYPCAYFGAVVEKSYPDWEERAWEEVLHKFDEMLTRRGHAQAHHERGIAIHDRSVTERTVQDWAEHWRILSGRIGVLTHLVDVPFFADSKATRLLQAADLICWALWRYYGLQNPDERWIKPLWPMFDADQNVMHGLIQRNSEFRQGELSVPALLESRLAGIR